MPGSFSRIQRKVKFLFFLTSLYWIFHALEEEGEKADSGAALVCWSKNLLWFNFALGQKKFCWFSETKTWRERTDMEEEEKKDCPRQDEVRG